MEHGSDEMSATEIGRGRSARQDSSAPPAAHGADSAQSPPVEAPGHLEPTAIESEPEATAEFFADRIELARQYVRSLASDGVVRGLIGPREAGRLWTRHVLNSAVATELLTTGSRVVDIGSGAGLPGIPLAIVRPDCEFVLVEPLERRTKYLLEIVGMLGLSNCRVVRGRADEVIGDCGGADVVTSRAVAPLARLAAWSAPLLRIGGELLALKGSSAPEEIARDRSAVASVGLAELSVKSCGAGVVDPETLVIRGIRIQVNGRGKSSMKPASPNRERRSSR